MNCVNCDICVYHLGLCVFFPGVSLSSRVTGACPVTTDLIMRVNVRTTTTTVPGVYQMHFLCAFKSSCPPAGVLSSWFRLRGMQEARRYTTAHILAPAGLRGACSVWQSVVARAGFLSRDCALPRGAAQDH